MKDKEFRQQQSRALKLIRKWEAIIGLGHWQVDHHFYRTAWTSSDNPSQWSPAIAETKADFKYKRADINWLLPDMADLSDRRLEALVIHELTHCLTDEFKQYAMDEAAGRAASMDVAGMERQTTEIACALR